MPVNFKPLRVFAGLLVLALLGSACLNMGATVTPTLTATPEPTRGSGRNQPRTTPGQTTTPEDGTVTGEQRFEPGGFTYTVIPNYQLDVSDQVVIMLAPDTNPDWGLGVMLMGGRSQEGATVRDYLAGFSFGGNFTLSEPVTITMGSASGLAVDFSGYQGFVRGRIVILMPTPTQVFVAYAVVTADIWVATLSPMFDEWLASITFFEPIDSFYVPEPSEGDGGTRQWATSAKASSEYGSPGWAASQATGESDVTTCGDNLNAWAAEQPNTVEWIELAYETPVVPTEIRIIESYNPDQVIKVELLDLDGEYHEVYSGKPQRVDSCPYPLSIDITDATYQTMVVKITVDQSSLATGVQIDAVELIGE
jgi:hypothetical protein